LSSPENLDELSSAQLRELVVILITKFSTLYRRERSFTPDGHTIIAPLPAGTRGHFSTHLRLFVLMQYHQGQTLPRLTALLQAVGLSISQRQIQRLLIEKHDGFQAEARAVLRADWRHRRGSRSTTWAHGIKPKLDFLYV